MSFRLAIIGRPNVGKSTLFNRLVGKKLALVDDQPGVTRDRREGRARLGDLVFTAIDTAAVRNVLGGDRMARMSRTPEIVADAAHAVLTRPARECTGHFFIDEEVLRAEGVTDFARYAPHAGDGPLVADFFVPEEVFRRSPTKVVKALEAH